MAWSDAARKAAAEARRRKRLLYHVTTTVNAQRILSTGIQTKQPGQWLKAGSGRRYGAGEVYAFERKLDAYRWAGKMDWEKHQGTGTGRIAIVKFKPDNLPWGVDKNDPLTQSSSIGKWLKRKQPVSEQQVLGMKRFTPKMVRRLMRLMRAK